MSPVATAPVEAPPAPPGRPDFFAVGWATFLDTSSRFSSRPVTDLAVVKATGSPSLQLERAGTLDIGSPQRDRLPLEPLAGVTLERDDFDNGIALMLRQGSSCPTPVGTLDAVWIRYAVLGMRHEQRIPLVDGPSVRCR